MQFVSRGIRPFAGLGCFSMCARTNVLIRKSVKNFSSLQNKTNGAESKTRLSSWIFGSAIASSFAAFLYQSQQRTYVECQKKGEPEDDKVIREYLTRKFSITHPPLVWIEKVNGSSDHYIEFRVNRDLVKLQYPDEVKQGLFVNLRGISHPKLSMEVIHQARNTDSGVVFRFQKKGEKFNKEEIETIGKVLNMMQRDETEMVQGFGSSGTDTRASGPDQSGTQDSKKRAEIIEELEQLGVVVYQDSEMKWDSLAGCNKIKQEVEDHILLALKHPEIFESISKGTRKYPKSNLPRAILFTGPPGTGKTSTARIIASQTSVPMVYVPLESVVSKYYGEAEKKLGQIFDACAELNGSIVFVDEIDSLATSRSGEIHEASRRTLSVLLRRIDGFQDNQKTLVIGATNRPQDLDEALLSRFDTTLSFPLPDESARAEIFGLYAIHLSESDRRILAQKTEGISGRTIKDACQQTERRWAAMLIRQKNAAVAATIDSGPSKSTPVPLPPIAEYLTSVANVMAQQTALNAEWQAKSRR